MNKRFVGIFSALLIMFFSGACLSFWTATHQDWDYVERSGGLSLGQVEKMADGKYRIQFIQHITNNNSGLGVRTESVVAGKDIRFWIVTYLLDGKTPQELPSIKIEDVAPGLYGISYMDRDGKLTPLGKIELL